MKKIQELEVGQARLKQEMSKLMIPGSAAAGDEDRRLRQRSLSASPQRSREPQGRRRSLGINDGGPAMRRGYGYFRNSSSPLQRESRNHSPSGAAATAVGGSIGLSERQHLKILQSMGQSVHISDVEGRIIYWFVLRFRPSFHLSPFHHITPAHRMLMNVREMNSGVIADLCGMR